MTMKMKTGTKLCLISHERDVYYQDTLVINSWPDVKILHVRSKPGYEQTSKDVQAAVSEHVQRHNIDMPLVFVGDEIDIEIYHLGEVEEINENQLQLELGI